MIGILGGLALLLPAAGLAQETNHIGERAFRRCYSCHSVEKGEKGLSGPSLATLKDRNIASDPDFEYSKAFKQFAEENGRWSAELLDRFLTDPEALVPGNKMGFFGLKNADDREAVIAYIMAQY